MASEMTDEQIDTLLNGESESRNIPMEKEEIAAPSAVEEYLLKVNGKEVKANRDQVVEWAQMGYNYPQRAAELKKQQDDWQKQVHEREGQFKQFEQKYSPYMQVDEYAQKNPQWWAQVQQAFQQKSNGTESPAEISRLKQEIMQEIMPVKEFIQQTQTKEQSAKIEKEDAQLANEVESIRKQYPNIDFNTRDADGRSLEMKILLHASEMGLDGSKPGHFRAAFRDYYHDNIVSRAQETAKQTVSKQVQKQTKLGILGESSKPTKGLQVATNVRSKSYNDLVQEALGEINN